MTMDPINEIELEDCPVCRGAGYIEDEQGWCMYACCLNCGTETAHVRPPVRLPTCGTSAR